MSFFNDLKIECCKGGLEAYTTRHCQKADAVTGHRPRFWQSGGHERLRPEKMLMQVIADDSSFWLRHTAEKV